MAAEACERSGKESDLHSILQQAVKSLPDECQAIRALARCELKRQRPDRALQTLVAGSQRFRRRRTRGDAILLLGDAREIEPWNPDVVIHLCRQLARSGDSAAALFLLDQLDGRVQGQERSAVRALLWRIEPSLLHTWRWLRVRSGVRRARARVVPARPRRAAS